MMNALRIKESFKITGSLNLPTIYRGEYKKYKDDYFKNNQTKDLIMTYILLQLSLESHFHYYINVLIGDRGEWDESTALILFDKNSRKEIGKIYKFFELLSSWGYLVNEERSTRILESMRQINQKRNKFIHAHTINHTIDSTLENVEETATKTLLTREKLIETINEANRVSDTWNSLLCELQKQPDELGFGKLPASHVIDYCKFRIF